jgi:hypothetical protein
MFVLGNDGKIIDALVSAVGPRQGCGAGTLMYCASSQEDYQKTLAAQPETKGYAIVDNFTVAGRLSKLSVSHAVYEKEAAERGSKVRLDKSAVHFYGNEAEAKRDGSWVEAAGLKFNRKATEFMGGILGHHEGEMKDLAMKKVMEIKRQMQKLISKHLPAQYALILLRICVEGKFRFLARTTPPEILREAAAALDNAKLEVYLKLCGILQFELDDRPEIEDQIFRPITLGGVYRVSMRSSIFHLWHHRRCVRRS